MQIDTIVLMFLLESDLFNTTNKYNFLSALCDFADVCVLAALCQRAAWISRCLVSDQMNMLRLAKQEALFKLSF